MKCQECGKKIPFLNYFKNFQYVFSCSFCKKDNRLPLLTSLSGNLTIALLLAATAFLNGFSKEITLVFCILFAGVFFRIWCYFKN